MGLIVLCQASIDGWEPGTRKGCHYISLHQIKVDRAIGVNLSTAVILSAAKDLCPRRVRPFPFAEFTLERSEGLRAAAHALRVTSDGRLPESVALENLLQLTPMGQALVPR